MSGFNMFANVLHIAVRAGFSVENSKRATMFKFTNKFQTEVLCPPDGNMFVVGRFRIPFMIRYIKYPIAIRLSTFQISNPI